MRMLIKYFHLLFDMIKDHEDLPINSEMVKKRLVLILYILGKDENRANASTIISKFRVSVG